MDKVTVKLKLSSWTLCLFDFLFVYPTDPLTNQARGVALFLITKPTTAKWTDTDSNTVICGITRHTTGARTLVSKWTSARARQFHPQAKDQTTVV